MHDLYNPTLRCSIKDVIDTFCREHWIGGTPKNPVPLTPVVAALAGEYSAEGVGSNGITSTEFVPVVCNAGDKETLALVFSFDLIHGKWSVDNIMLPPNSKMTCPAPVAENVQSNHRLIVVVRYMYIPQIYDVGQPGEYSRRAASKWLETTREEVITKSTKPSGHGSASLSAGDKQAPHSPPSNVQKGYLFPFPKITLVDHHLSGRVNNVEAFYIAGEVVDNEYIPSPQTSDDLYTLMLERANRLLAPFLNRSESGSSLQAEAPPSEAHPLQDVLDPSAFFGELEAISRLNGIEMGRTDLLEHAIIKMGDIIEEPQGSSYYPSYRGNSIGVKAGLSDTNIRMLVKNLKRKYGPGFCELVSQVDETGGPFTYIIVIPYSQLERQVNEFKQNISKILSDSRNVEVYQLRTKDANGHPTKVNLQKYRDNLGNKIKSTKLSYLGINGWAEILFLRMAGCKEIPETASSTQPTGYFSSIQDVIFRFSLTEEVAKQVVEAINTRFAKFKTPVASFVQHSYGISEIQVDGRFLISGEYQELISDMLDSVIKNEPYLVDFWIAKSHGNSPGKSIEALGVIRSRCKTPPGDEVPYTDRSQAKAQLQTALGELQAILRDQGASAEDRFRVSCRAARSAGKFKSLLNDSQLVAFENDPEAQLNAIRRQFRTT